MEARPPVARWLALVALIALVGSGSLCAWWIVADRADFERASQASPPPEP